MWRHVRAFSIDKGYTKEWQSSREGIALGGKVCDRIIKANASGSNVANVCTAFHRITIGRPFDGDHFPTQRLALTFADQLTCFERYAYSCFLSHSERIFAKLNERIVERLTLEAFDLKPLTQLFTRPFRKLTYLSISPYIGPDDHSDDPTDEESYLVSDEETKGEYDDEEEPSKEVCSPLELLELVAQNTGELRVFKFSLPPNSDKQGDLFPFVLRVITANPHLRLVDIGQEEQADMAEWDLFPLMRAATLDYLRKITGVSGADSAPWALLAETLEAKFAFPISRLRFFGSTLFQLVLCEDVNAFVIAPIDHIKSFYRAVYGDGTTVQGSFGPLFSPAERVDAFSAARLTTDDEARNPETFPAEICTFVKWMDSEIRSAFPDEASIRSVDPSALIRAYSAIVFLSHKRLIDIEPPLPRLVKVMRIADPENPLRALDEALSEGELGHESSHHSYTIVMAAVIDYIAEEAPCHINLLCHRRSPVRPFLPAMSQLLGYRLLSSPKRFQVILTNPNLFDLTATSDDEIAVPWVGAPAALCAVMFASHEDPLCREFFADCVHYLHKHLPAYHVPLGKKKNNILILKVIRLQTANSALLPLLLSLICTVEDLTAQEYLLAILAAVGEDNSSLLCPVVLNSYDAIVQRQHYDSLSGPAPVPLKEVLLEVDLFLKNLPAVSV